jgi:adenylylsulfate kinase
MKLLANKAKRNGSYVICDFVCPTKQLRTDFNADFVVWMDTIDEGRFEDTNQIFEPLEKHEYHAVIIEHEWWNTQHAKLWAQEIIKRLETNGKL